MGYVWLCVGVSAVHINSVSHRQMTTYWKAFLLIDSI